ncbi:MAG: AIR synthase-related protein [Blautia glucerasea]|nr:AIR synthase-related protein [Blautia glucerasea]MDY5020981.1 AIR synthase-related protein [Blautia sp.]
MRLGQKAMEALRAEVDGLLCPGDELVVVGEIALKGTSMIASAEYHNLRRFFSESFLRDAVRLCEKYGIKNIQSFADTAGKAGASAFYAMGEGGFLAALWKMAEASQVGLQADLRKVPIRQETIEICERYDINPYRLFSEGAVLLGMPGGHSFVQECRLKGISASVIGQTDAGNDRLLFSGSNARFLERPTEDELRGVLKQWQN